MARLFVFLLALLVSACGGGGSDSTAPAVVVVAPPAPVAVILSGVAATGSPIAGRIFLKDAAGHEQFVDTTDGRFSFTITDLSAPLMLKAQWSAGGSTATLYSLAASAAGGTANITPLTNMAVASAAGTGGLDAVYDAGGAGTFAAIAAALPAAVAQVQQSLAPLLAKQGVGALDPISGGFAPDHTGMDAVLDSITVTLGASGRVTVADKSSGALVLDAPAADLSHAMTVSDWSAQDAAVAADPDLAVAKNGDALVAWSEFVGQNVVVRARFLAGGSSAPVALSPSGDAGLAKVAFDAAADALVVWTQYENGRNDIWARRYSAATTAWAAPLRLSSMNAPADSNVPDIAVDAAGNAIVVWHQGDGRTNHFDVWSARYAASTDAWTAAALLSDGVASAYNPHVALNAAGQGIAGWEQEQGDGTVVSNAPKDVWARRVASDGTQSTPLRLNAVAGNIDGVYGQVALAMDAQGDGMALWVQGSGQLPFVVHAARLLAGAGWQGENVITSNPLDNSYGPHIAFDMAGNAVAVWQQQTGVGAYGGVNRFDAATGWGVSGSFGTDVAGDVYDPRVAVDGAGNATAVWYQMGADGSTAVMSSRSLAGGAWSASQLLGATAAGFSYPVPRVAANTSGRTIAIWGTDSY